MTIKLSPRLLIALFLLAFSNGHAQRTAKAQDAYQDFWNPTYHTKRLNYCLIDGKTCGIKVANQYCQGLGFQQAYQAKIDHNVGLTNVFNSNASCKGWQCDGFKVIRCTNRVSHQPVAAYYYRDKAFSFPRVDHYRVAWCLQKGKHCGKATALSFCRRLGYRQIKRFKIQTQLPATKTLGSQELCYHTHCNGFGEIICQR